MMKKICIFALFAAMMLGLSACGSSDGSTTAGSSSTAETTAAASLEAEDTTEAVTGTKEDNAPETVTIKSLNAAGEETDLEVPYNPERIAILDMASMDILDSLGVGDRIVGTASTSLEYLQKYAEDESL